MKKKNNNNIAIGIGLATLAATTAGAYFLYGTKKGKVQRKAIKSWTLKMKGDVMDEVEKLKDVSEESYHKAIDKVSKKYNKMKNMDMVELAETADSLKSHWKDIKKEIGI
jgi:hypothetical protein